MYNFNGKYNTINFLHAAPFNLVEDTHEKSFNWGYFNTWPVLMAITIGESHKTPHHTQVVHNITSHQGVQVIDTDTKSSKI